MQAVAEESRVGTHEINESAIRNRSLKKWINAVIYFFERLIIKVYNKYITKKNMKYEYP